MSRRDVLIAVSSGIPMLILIACIVAVVTIWTPR